MGKKTALFAKHEYFSAKLVDFGGWDMPIHYGSQLEEHNHVRSDAGMFDVSHMTIVDVTGTDARNFLHYLLANDVDKLTLPGKALYSGMLNESGGVIDDLIVYRRDEGYRIVVNCATREKDLDWMDKQSSHFDVALVERPEIAIIAVQGPQALVKAKQAMGETKAAVVDDLVVFQGQEIEGWFIARTGYTGEDGLEIMLPEEEAADFWQALADAGVAPIGLGARDTLRLEAGMNLYGTDMDETISPYSANMGWCVALKPEDRDFIGRDALEKIKAAGGYDRLVGLVLEQRGVLRGGMKVIIDGIGEGITTSGTFSPTLGHAVALARVPSATGETTEVEVRGKRLPVRVIKPGFVRMGKKVF